MKFVNTEAVPPFVCRIVSFSVCFEQDTDGKSRCNSESMMDKKSTQLCDCERVISNLSQG